MSGPMVGPREEGGTAQRAPGASFEPLRRRALFVLGARLLVAVSLLGASLILAPSGPTFTSQALLSLIAAALGTTIAFAIALQRHAPITMVAGAQVALDLGLVTGLVYLTGGAHSGFGSLYAAVILVAALLLGPRATLAVAALGLLLYLALSLGIVTGLVAPPPDQPLTSYVIAPDSFSIAVLRTAVGLIVVAALGGTLSERLSRASGEAVRATEAARGYQQFAEDVVRSISSGLVTTTIDGRIASANAVGAQLLGATVDELLDRPVGDFLPAGASPEARRVEGRATRADGTTFPVGLTRTPLLGPAADVRGALVVFQDLSELVALRQSAEKSERLAALGRLAAGLAHEIRNPLGSISGSVELVRDAGTLGAEDRRLLDLVLEEAARLDELASTMLSVGRPTLPERAAADVALITREVIDVARSKSKVAIELDAPEPATALVDTAMFRQVVWNLAKNAIQFSPKGGTVKVHVRAVPDGAVLEVADDGPGIPAADRERIFDMFFTKRAHGVGVGLALVRQIAEAHGAAIEVESEEGQGTTFRVRFPRQ